MEHRDAKSDLDLLQPYIVTREMRRQMPVMSDPDPDTLWRMELFYNAIGLTPERITGIMVSPLMKLHHEGFRRLVLTAGRLIVINKHLRGYRDSALIRSRAWSWKARSLLQPPWSGLRSIPKLRAAENSQGTGDNMVITDTAVQSLTRDGSVWTPSYLLAIDQEVCMGCGRCFKVCGRSVMTLQGVTEDGVLVELDDDEEILRKG